MTVARGDGALQLADALLDRFQDHLVVGIG
jgi:hypothetical protein